MAILNFIIDNILINAAVILGLVALLGLILQKKPFADCLSGTFKTMMGFMVLSAGANVIVGALEPFSVWFAAGLGIDGAVASIEAVLAVAMQNEVVGRDIALVYAGIFAVNLILARFTKLKYVFLNGEAPFTSLWPAFSLVWAFAASATVSPSASVPSWVVSAASYSLPWHSPSSARSPAAMISLLVTSVLWVMFSVPALPS